MTDTMTPEQRHACMAAVKGKNTKPEMLVRRYLFSRGLRYRVNDRRYPGTPDIVLPKYRVVVFVDGCFWHGHEGCRYFRLPTTNPDFWHRKIIRNQARDVADGLDLQTMGWRVIRVWECELKPHCREQTLSKLYARIVGATVDTEEERAMPPIAADPETPYGQN